MTYSIVKRRPRRQTFSPPLEAFCPMCGRRTICMLPPHLLRIQPDDTNAVCLHLIGGCDQGYAIDVGKLRSYLDADTMTFNDEDTIRTTHVWE